ncbi:hypothetical protein Rfer_4367 (plasmid) [Rhodoferax ferrireducens T118]|uniref:Uncharacterized protein n=1 Tax=Albidiferax ferrireducens (strain ATCC BAA-621 / DSM 15236 / T118) TaxID=338969 RepID=Q21Q92_ALBFT|nr:hypothetical protein [Rhodoferax ferrireducens]ABD72053.1 hypothetical protein Rfer_4367 [Rhodoferax ferrireducens T118]
MAVNFCQYIDVRFDPGTSDALCARLIERLSAIAAALGQLPGVLFGHERPRLIDWPHGIFQWRADCWVIKPRGITWDEVFAVVSNIKAVPFDKCTDKHARKMIEVNAASAGNRAFEDLSAPKALEPVEVTGMKKERPSGSHSLDEWTSVCLAPTGKPFELKPTGYTCRGTNDLERAKQYAREALEFFQGHGLEIPVFVVMGPTSTTRCRFEVVTATCGYSVLHRIGVRTLQPASSL